MGGKVCKVSFRTSENTFNCTSLREAASEDMEYLVACTLNQKDLMQFANVVDFDEKEKDAIESMFRSEAIDGLQFVQRYDKKESKESRNALIEKVERVSTASRHKVKAFLQQLRYYPMYAFRFWTVLCSTCTYSGGTPARNPASLSTAHKCSTYWHAC